ncbi:MAG: T9SS type A sorting domain-containing protein, partial [Flavobacteriales bacterium]|nr:T9SS type A sorting domain-containing protein [Flavobacteriales bacterium]
TEMSVFPNPTEGAVNINYTAAKDGLVNVRVFDVVGKAVADFNYAVNAGDNFLNMDLSSFENGVYVIEVLEGKNSTTSRVMLK